MKYLAWFGDTHAVHQYGLLSPTTILHREGPDGELEEYRPELNATQKFLWELYQRSIEWIAKVTQGSELTVFFGGDLAQGLKHPEELLSQNPRDHVVAGADLLDMWTALPNLHAMRVLTGTGAHSPLGSIEQLAVEILKARHPDLDVQCVGHSRLIVMDGEQEASARTQMAGVVVDAAHHGPGVGIRRWTQGNQVRYYMRSLWLDDVAAGLEPPGLILRFHRHMFRWETLHDRHCGKIHTYHMFVSPALCGLSHYARQATLSQHKADVGLMLAGIENHRVVRIWPIVEFKDARTKEYG